MNIPKVVGEGGYGCVHKPNLLCEGDDKQDKENVSKLMKGHAALSELKEYVVIDNIDKSKYFYLVIPKKCNL